MDKTTKLSVLIRMRKKLDRLIEIKSFGAELAKMMSSEYLDRSNTGWLTSMFNLKAGTLLAVWNSSDSSEYLRDAMTIERELIELFAEREQLESRITHLRRAQR